MLIRLEGFALVAGLILWLIALAESITADESRVRNLPKTLWIILILVTFDVGAILWFVLGRPTRAQRSMPYKGNAGAAPPPPPTRRSGAVGPDDDPGFLDSLRSDKLQSWEDDLARRERELKQREDGPGEQG